MNQKIPIASVDLIIFKDNKILLEKVGDKWKDNGKYEWGLPGREIDFGDNFKETVKKNLKEELCMILKNFRVICINNNFGFNNHYIAIGILVEAEGKPKVMNSEKWKEWKWFDKDRIPNKLFPSAKLTIKCFLEGKAAVE